MAAEDRAFAPASPTALSAAPDGSWVAVVEPGGITIVDPVTAAIHAEVGVAADCECDVGWAGNPSRLVVVQRHPDHSIVHLVDVHAGPRPLGEVRIERPVHVLASGALHVLIVDDKAASVVGAAGDRLAILEFPSRSIPSAAGAFGPHHVIVAVAGVLEEWDTHARHPRRRFRMPKPVAISHLGGTDRLLWSVSPTDPDRVVIFPLINRGQPRVHELPEPIAAIAGHPKVDLLVWIGAATGTAWVLDLDGRDRGRALGEPGSTACAIVAGPQISAVLAAPERFLSIEVLDSRGVDARHGGVVSITDPDLGEVGLPPPEIPVMPDLGDLGDLDGPAARATDAIDRAASAADRISTIGTPEPTSPATVRDLAQRLAGWRAANPAPAPRATGAAGDPAPVPPAAGDPALDVGDPGAGRAPAATPPASWREAVVAWTRGALAGRTADPPGASALDQLAHRLDLAPPLAAGVAVLYGAHLLGHDGVAAADLAQVVGWVEALGTGELARTGVARWRRSRVRIAPVIRDALDERPARTGTIVGATATASTLVTPCAVRIDTGRAADAAPRLVTSHGGAYLVVAATADPTDAILEARARGAIALADGDRVPLGPHVARVIGPGATADVPVIDA